MSFKIISLELLKKTLIFNVFWNKTLGETMRYRVISKDP